MEVISDTGNSLFGRFFAGRLSNVRLAALDLREISGVDMEGSGLDPGIPGFRVHLNSRVLTSPECYLLCKSRRIRDLGCAWEFLNVVNSVPGHFLRKLSNFSDSGESENA